MDDRPTVRVALDGASAWVTLDRPEHHNAMTNRMLHELTGTLAGLAGRDDVHVIVLTGAGRSFCPGADLRHYAEGGEDRPLGPGDFDAPALLHELPQLTLAAVNGACAGAGLTLACACDLRVAAASARFNTAFLDVGVAGDMGGPWTLPRLVGAGRARDLYFLPRKFDAEEALRTGLVTGVFPDDAFAAELDALVARLVAADPAALRAMKANFLAAERSDLRTYLALETERHLRFTQHDAAGFRASAARRARRLGGG